MNEENRLLRMEDRMENSFERVDKKLDNIHEKISTTEVILARNTESLIEHIKRTNLLEAQMKPISKHVIMIEGVLKFFGVVAMVASFAATIFKISEYI